MLRTFTCLVSSLILIAILLLNVPPISAQDKQQTKQWAGRLANGTVISEYDLRSILEKHKRWKKREGKEGEPADLSGADLRKAELRKANLCKADLSRANLSGAILNGASLIEANLSKAELRKADLRKAELSRADLFGANLNEADLSGANLSGTIKLCEANLSNADLSGADLSGADLFGAKLSGANLRGADLRKADLRKVDLSGAHAAEANFAFAVYESEHGTLPDIPSLSTAKALWLLSYDRSPHGLTELRDALKRDGLRQQEREVTYAISHTSDLKALKGGVTDKIEGTFNYVFLELPTMYGMKPGRAIRVLLLLIPVFCFFYLWGLKGGGKKTGIWIVMQWDKAPKGAGKDRCFKLTPQPTLGRTTPIKSWIMWRKAYWWFRLIRIALYFSILSAFSIGWRELNVGNWIARLQRREYVLRATGWVRTVSGLQSLISVYLVAMWALTYFGRPFE